MTDQTIDKRVERKESQQMNVTLVSGKERSEPKNTEPVIVQIHNKESDRIHTVVPESMHCSCEDHTYRGSICKHLLKLLDAEGHVGEITREAIKNHRDDLEHESCELRDRIHAIEDEIDSIVDALNAVDASHARQQTTTDIIEALAADASGGSE